MVLIHYCTVVLQYGVILLPVVQYHPVLQNNSAIMVLFLFHTSFSSALDQKKSRIKWMFGRFFLIG